MTNIKINKDIYWIPGNPGPVQSSIEQKDGFKIFAAAGDTVDQYDYDQKTASWTIRRTDGSACRAFVDWL